MSLLILPGVARATAVDQTPPFGVGQQITATPDNPGDGIQWMTCDGASLTANNDDSYTIRETDVGTTICAQDTVTMTTSSPQGPIVDPGAMPPNYTGTTTVGQTLHVVDGTWADTPTTINVKWFDCTAPAGTSGCTAIARATSSAYQLRPSDQDKAIEVQETPVYSGTPASDAVKSSVVSNTVAGAVPTVGGTTQTGQTLTAAPVFIGDQIQWFTCTAGGTTGGSLATGTTYAVKETDLGTSLCAVETTTDSTPATLTSAPAGPITDPAQTPPTNATTAVGESTANTVPPAISGSARQGATLTASPGSWSGSPTGFTYQWVRCPASAGGCTAIAGATSAGYVPVAADAGHALAVIVAAKNAGGSGPAVTSARTAAISATTTAKLKVTGSVKVAGGSTRLAVVVTSGSSAIALEGTVTITRGGKAVKGCTGLAVKGSAGQSVTVRCTAHLGAGKGRLSAVFTPSGGKPLAVSAPATHAARIAPAPTTTLLDAPTRATVNAQVTYSARVESSTGQAPKTGTVVFEDKGRAIAGCESRPITDGTATCTLSYGLTGRHLIKARFKAAGNFAASTSGPTPERISEPRAHGAVTATLNWTFNFTPGYTSIQALVLHRAPRGSTLTIRCGGRGCPFGSRTLHVRGSKTVNLEHAFHGRHLKVRTKLVITITRPSYVGKYYRFTIRPRREPKILISCLALGSRRPGVGCTRP